MKKTVIGFEISKYKRKSTKKKIGLLAGWGINFFFSPDRN